MGQVPPNKPSLHEAQLTYGIVGRGKMARHFAHYLRLKGLPFVSWSRDQNTPPEQSLSSCNVLLVLISDDAIEPWIKSQSWLSAKVTCVHFSGRLSTPLAIGLHPLMTFGPELYSLSQYENIWFVSEVGRVGFEDLFPDLKNPSSTLDPSLKPLYHGLVAMAGNFTVLLWQKIFEDFQNKLGLPPASLQPYMIQIFENLTTSPKTALTGPLARGDFETLQAHIQALEGDSYQAVYRSFVKAFDPKIQFANSAEDRP